VNDIGASSLGDAAYRAIKRDIIHCAVDPGSQVTEAQLAVRYGLGRAAVRTALSRLHHDRLVQVLPRAGYRIAPITIKSVRDLFQIRMLLEPAAVRMAAGQIDLAMLDRLDQLCQASYRLGDQESAHRFLRSNTELHVSIARASGNERLTQMITGLLEEMERLFHLGLMLRDRNAEMYHEHHDLIEALRAGDGDRAEAVAIEQIEAAKHMVMDALLSCPTLESVNLVAR
jgi:DNA-binding GntR family transcriptional regulator